MGAHPPFGPLGRRGLNPILSQYMTPIRWMAGSI